MNKKFKKIGYRIGIIPIIIVLSIGLLASGAVLADDGEVEPQATATGTVTPNMVTNDGASVLHFSWDIYDWAGTADYYTFQVNVRGQPGTPLYIQYSDDEGTDTFPPGDISDELQDINGTVGAPAVHVRQPAYTDTHDWTVPDTVAPGLYAAWVNLYLEGQTAAAAGAYIPFSIEQTVEIRKFNDENGNGIKDGGEMEISGTWNVQVWDPSMVSIYNGTMPAVFNVTVAGTFTATETLIAGWEVTTPPGSPSVTQTFVIPDLDEIVWFGNKELPQLGDLEIHKYEDLNGDGIDNDGLDLAGLTFNIFGPDDPSALYSTNMTDANGDIYLTGIPVGQYKVEEIVPPADPAWRCTDPGPGLVVMVNVTATPAYVDFGNQQLGDLLIYKYEDLDGSGTLNAGDIDGPGWKFTISGPSGPMNVGPTPVSGEILIEDIIPGSYSVKETTGPAAPPGWAWVCTDPGSGKTKTATVPSGGMDEVQFGNWLVERKVPTLGQWGIIGMSTVFAAMLVWFGVRRRRLAQMK